MMILLALAIGMQIAAASTGNPLAPALGGKLECARPDLIKKTCRALTRYERVDQTRYVSTTTIALSPNGPLVFENRSPVEVQGESVCGSIKASDVTSGHLRMGDRQLSDTEASPILQRIVSVMAPIIDKKICTVYRQRGGVLFEEGSVDGLRRPDTDKPVMWVAPTEGYTIAA